MKLTRQQRINNAANSIVDGLNNVAQQCQKVIKEGLTIKPNEGYPELKASGQEVLDALGDNAKDVQIVLSFILEGKSNKILKSSKNK